jgi:uncharacterized coiled-coil DUF342 family protein
MENHSEVLIYLREIIMASPITEIVNKTKELYSLIEAILEENKDLKNTILELETRIDILVKENDEDKNEIRELRKDLHISNLQKKSLKATMAKMIMQINKIKGE